MRLSIREASVVNFPKLAAAFFESSPIVSARLKLGSSAARVPAPIVVPLVIAATALARIVVSSCPRSANPSILPLVTVATILAARLESSVSLLMFEAALLETSPIVPAKSKSASSFAKAPAPLVAPLAIWLTAWETSKLLSSARSF